MLKKLPQISLIVFVVLSVGIAIAFFLGLGKTVFVSPNTFEEMKDSTFTDPFMYYTYILTLLTLCLVLFFVIVSLVRGLKYNTKRTVGKLVAVVALISVFVISWFCGSPCEIEIVGYSGGQNFGRWAQFSDMILFSSYTLIIATFIALLGSFIYSRVK